MTEDVEILNMAKKSVTPDLSYEEVQNIKAALWAVPQTAAGVQAQKAMLPKRFRTAATVKAAMPPPATLVAEGDSWFDYAPGLDVLDQLRLRHWYEIVKLSAAGDTLENIAFGTEIGRDFSRLTPQINVLIETVARARPRVVLLSGGGNDIAGDELDSFLNHADSGLPGLRLEYLKDVVQGLFRSAYERLARSIWEIDSTICIVTHGYGYPIPDGRAVFNFPFNFRFVGPWLRPAFTRKNITNLAVSKGIVTAAGRAVTVTTGHGSVTLPVQTADMPDRVVWLPAHSPGCEVRRSLGARHGSLVSLRGTG